MNPILFLDFDGPLFPENFIPHSKPISQYPGSPLHPWITYWEMSLTSVRQLNALYDIYKFDTIVSSSWKHYVTPDQVRELFAANKLNLRLHKDLPFTPDKLSSYRINDISWALQELTVDGITPSHIILDDPWSGSYLENWKDWGLHEPVMVDPNVGISRDDWRAMHAVVRNWAEDPDSRQYTRVTNYPRPFVPDVDVSQVTINNLTKENW